LLTAQVLSGRIAAPTGTLLSFWQAMLTLPERAGTSCMARAARHVHSHGRLMTENVQRKVRQQECKYSTFER